VVVIVGGGDGVTPPVVVIVGAGVTPPVVVEVEPRFTPEDPQPATTTATTIAKAADREATDREARLRARPVTGGESMPGTGGDGVSRPRPATGPSTV